jgi:hypothetical protein
MPPTLYSAGKTICQPLYQELIGTPVHTVKADDIATFLGKKLNGNYNGEMGNPLQRADGRHACAPFHGPEFDQDVRQVRPHSADRNHHSGCHLFSALPPGRTAGRHDRHEVRADEENYSLGALQEVLAAANRRYLEFLSALDDPSGGIGKLNHLSQTISQDSRSYRGFNFFDPRDEFVFQVIARGEFSIRGFHNRRLRSLLPGFNSGQVSRLLKRLRVHGLIKKIGHGYKYYLTALGRQVTALGLRLKNLVIIPHLALHSVP